MSDTRHFILAHDTARRTAAACCMLPEYQNYHVRITPPTRSLDQSAKFHALCGDIAKQIPFAGKLRTPEQWKILLVSGHAIATKQGSEMMPGLEGEFLNLRESTAAMSIKRLSSLIEYATAYAVSNGVKLHDGAEM